MKKTILMILFFVLIVFNINGQAYNYNSDNNEYGKYDWVSWVLLIGAASCSIETRSNLF